MIRVEKIILIRRKIIKVCLNFLLIKNWFHKVKFLLIKALNLIIIIAGFRPIQHFYKIKIVVMPYNKAIKIFNSMILIRNIIVFNKFLKRKKYPLIEILMKIMNIEVENINKINNEVILVYKK